MTKKNPEEQGLETKKKEIQDLGLSAIRDYFKIDVSSLSRDLLKSIHEKARLAMSFEKEMNLSKRAVEMNYLRVFKMISEDKEEIKKLIKKHMPKYL